ncbi:MULTISPECIES: metal ABC transporter substrate-binding protein [unclassified Microcoleus]|uniref:metal ABC transporter substrate-binding protein n=1 Tax=unclassified Microcoleus TaxID=2642155 RepID=UPI00403F7479
MGHGKLETPQTIGLAAKISSRLKQISSTLLNNRQDVCSTKNQFSCGVGIRPVKNGQDVCSTKNQFSCGVGIRPVKNGQDACSTKNQFSCGVGILPVKNRQDACSTKNQFSCGTGILPVPKRPTKNQFSCGLGILPVKNGQDARSTKNQFSCGTGILPVPKQVIDNGVRCELKPTAIVKQLDKGEFSRELGIETAPGLDKSKAFWIRTIACGILTVGLFSCAQTQGDRLSPQADAKPKVVATSTIIEDLTDRVAGDEIQLTGILQPGTDPHVYEPVPKDSQALEQANLILYNGYNLEPGLIRMMNAAGIKARKLAVGEVVKPLLLNKEGNTVPDPHVWGNVENAVQMVEAIRDALIELSPEDREKFTQNAVKLTEELKRLDSWIEQQIKTIPENQRKLVTSHDAFQYYSRAYGLGEANSLIGISTEEQPSAQTVQKLVESVKAAGVPAIFAETTINPQLIRTVAEEAGVKLAAQQLYSDSIGTPGSEGDSYVKMMSANTRAIVEALGGKYTPFEVSK